MLFGDAIELLFPTNNIRIEYNKLDGDILLSLHLDFILGNTSEIGLLFPS